MAFYYFATVEDLAEIFADIEGESPVRIVYEHNKTSTGKACYSSIRDIPGFSDRTTTIRHRPDFLVFPYQCEPVLTEVDVPTRTLQCIYRCDNPDAVDVRQPSPLYIESFARPELRAGEISFFAAPDCPGEPAPTDHAKWLAGRIRKAVRRRSCLLFTEGRKRVYIARRALEKAQKGDIDLIWSHRCWSAAETPDDAELLQNLVIKRPAKAESPVEPRPFGNLATIRDFRIRRAEFDEPDDPDFLFVAAFDDLKPVFDAACTFDDMNYSRLGPSRHRSICQAAGNLPGLGASALTRELDSGILAWRQPCADYDLVHEPHVHADYRIGLLPDGYTAPSLVVFPGGAHLRRSNGLPKRLLCGYVRLVHGSGRDHFEQFCEAVLAHQVNAVQLQALPGEIPVLPAAEELISGGVELDSSLLAHHERCHRLSAKPDNVIIFPDWPGTGSG